MDKPVTLLRCSRCKVEKPEYEFHRHKGRRTGRHHYCIICHRKNPNPRKPVFPRRRTLTPPELRQTGEGELWCTGCETAKAVDLFSRNKRQKTGRCTWCKACIKRCWQRPENLVRRHERREADWPHSLTIECRTRARIRGLPFNITKEDIQVPEFCPVLGIKLRPKQKRLAPDTPTVDRLDPTKGYVKGNVAVISWMANRIKSDCGDPAVFETIAAYIRRGLDGSSEHRSGLQATEAVPPIPPANAEMGLYRGAQTRRKERLLRDGPDRRRVAV
jgi:hypothetical protein